MDSNFSIPNGVATVGTSAHSDGRLCGKYASTEWTRQRWMKIESSPKLGLGTIYIALLCEELIILKHVSRRSTLIGVENCSCGPLFDRQPW